MTSALKCYKCNERNGENCNDPTSASSPETCETVGSCYWGKIGVIDGK